MNGRMVDYNGDRSAQHLKDWAISLIPNKVNTLRHFSQQAQLSLLSAKDGATGSEAWWSPDHRNHARKVHRSKSPG